MQEDSSGKNSDFPGLKKPQGFRRFLAGRIPAVSEEEYSEYLPLFRPQRRDRIALGRLLGRNDSADHREN
ncbi:MAG: hypothetical protein IKD68_12210, partial [Solobacterium sp.]|nr:hypothetical protein [Solobacterium sp.]